MAEYTREDVVRMCNEQDIEFIRLQFTDISGTLKNIAVTVSQLERALDKKIDEEVFLRLQKEICGE